MTDGHGVAASGSIGIAVMWRGKAVRGTEFRMCRSPEGLRGGGAERADSLEREKHRH